MIQLDYAWSVRKSNELSLQQVERAVSVLEVISILNGAGISFVLVGAHGLSGWVKRERATEDVDVVVATKHLKKATRVLLQAFPHLEPDEHEVVVRLRDRESQKVIIDLMKPNALYREVFKHTHTVTEGRQQYRVPTLEMCLTMKFAAMLSPLRGEDRKHQDIHDFIRMIYANPDIDVEQLSELGELVFGGGGADIVEKVRKVRAGEKLVL